MRGAGRSKALVANWLDVQSEPVQVLAKALLAAIHEAAPELCETVKWGNVVLQHEGHALLAISPHKAHVALQVFNGAQLPPTLMPLEGSGRGGRMLRFKLNQPVDPVVVDMLVSASVAAAEREAAQRPPRARPPGDEPAD